MALRVGIVGYGHIGQVHKNAMLADPKHFKLAAIKTSHPENVEPELRHLAIKTIDEFISKRPQLAIICTPAGTHAEVSIPLMSRGIHILTEKPIDATVSQAEAMAENAKRYGVRLMVAQNDFFDPYIKKAKELISSGAIGRVYGFHVNRERAELQAGRNPGDDVLKDCLIHDFVNLCYLFGERVVSVSAIEKKVNPKNAPPSDWGCGIANFESISGTFQASWTSHHPRRTAEIIGERGILQIDMVNRRFDLVTDSSRQAILSGDKVDKIALVQEAAYNTIINNTEFPVRFEDALYALRVCCAIEESAEKGGELIREI